MIGSQNIVQNENSNNHSIAVNNILRHKVNRSETPQKSR